MGRREGGEPGFRNSCRHALLSIETQTLIIIIFLNRKREMHVESVKEIRNPSNTFCSTKTSSKIFIYYKI